MLLGLRSLFESQPSSPTGAAGGVLLDLGARKRRYREQPEELRHVETRQTTGGEILRPAGTRAREEQAVKARHEERQKLILDDELALLLILSEID